MAIIVPISQLNNGVVASNSALASISVATLGENAVVQTLGRVSPNDGGAGVYYFSAGSSATVDSINVVSTPTTGRWIAALPGFSGVGPIQSSLTGHAETFVLVSGLATPITYTLPVTTNMQGKTVTVKSVTTGTVNIRCGNATDLIVNAGVSAAASVGASVAATLTGGAVFNFLAYGARWYECDKPFGAI